MGSTHAKHLFKDDLEGYIQILKLENGRVIKVVNKTKPEEIEYIAEVLQGEKDVYISANSFYIPKRSSQNIRHFRALFIDIDLDLEKISKTEAVYKSYDLVHQEKIPEPSMVVDSGRGIHMYWKIQHAPVGAIYTWQELEDYLYHQLKDLGADIRATDCSRVLRLPGTINSRNNSLCEVMLLNEKICYSMYDLREKYLNFNPVKQKYKKTENKKNNVRRYFNSYTLHLARARDIEKLCKIRKYQVTGYRNMIIHCYAYWEGIYTRDLQELEFLVSSLNAKFTEPLKDNEIRSIVKSVQKAIEKFIEYEQGLRDGQVKRVSKGMNDKGGYWYKNETLIERLDITLEEQRQLDTIIGKSVKYERRNKERNHSRRNNKGLTIREQQKQDTISSVLNMKLEGHNNTHIAQALGVSRVYVSKIVNGRI